MDNLEQKALSLRNEYYKNWRKKNKEKVRLTNKRYWMNQALKESNKEDRTDE